VIHDMLENLYKYQNIPRVREILTFLDNAVVSDLPEGDIPIQGDDLYVKILRYVPELADSNSFETHNVYTDVQIVFDGVELMQTAPPESLREKPEVHVDGDFQFYYAEEYISAFVVRAGQFVVFFPREAHRPGCRYRHNDGLVTKLVFKSKTADDRIEGKNGRHGIL